MRTNLFLKIGSVILFLAIIFFALFVIYNREKNPNKNFHPAMYYDKLGDGLVRCNLCPNRCILQKGEIGKCKARKNINGELYSLVYGNVTSLHLDPIEKKPFFHVLPGSTTFSISTTGCNLQCLFCQNWQISQIFPWQTETRKMTAEEVVEEALKSGAKSIAFTYNEPTVYYEYMLDIAKLAKERGLKTLVVSSGYINPEPLKNLLPYIDAYKIDFKGFKNDFYQKLTIFGKVEPVMETMRIIKQSGVWLEIVNLLIPGENDSEEDIEKLSIWIKENLGEETPLHFSRFFPNYKLQNLPPTPFETLIKAREIAKRVGLKYVYTGNVDYSEGETTFCPNSGEVAIERKGYFVVKNNLKNGLCPSGEKIPGIW